MSAIEGGLKLYLISQNVNQGPNFFDSAVVLAATAAEAALVNPIDGTFMNTADWQENTHWCRRHEQVKVYPLGVAYEGVLDEVGGRVVIASFNSSGTG